MVELQGVGQGRAVVGVVHDAVAVRIGLGVDANHLVLAVVGVVDVAVRANF